MALTGIIVSVMPMSQEQIDLGISKITHAQADESGFLYLLGLLGAILFAGIFLSLNNIKLGNIICNTWAAIYSLTTIPFIYFAFNISNVFIVVIMFAYSVGWYYGSRKTIQNA